MSFGPESTNPRERRAYAHAMIHKARETAGINELYEAQDAVAKVGTSRKSTESGYEGAVLGAVMADQSSRTIIELALRVDDPSQTPAEHMLLKSIGKNHDRVGIESDDCRTGISGVWMGRFGVSDAKTGEVDTRTVMWVADFDNLSRIDIPGTQDGRFDPIAIRKMADESRVALAGIVNKIN